ncbi:hypothetical protein ACFOUP_04650 [Belliella kenyensis]|uniref:Viral A-type inclusion protein n=1 Tax=Belliella kenyensis TaxID=1472724 RepID=A0ABV8EKW6_9BACT|nr:hypothetical protein [Belliella kenyensis]MCH7403455.1 hypothetical protein [Belliella kenyensis]MDN3602355.1 hypothetical protein [Belliella kenyensis]
MNAYLRNFYVLILISMFFSCKEDKALENQKLRDEVIQIHDEVMPFMGELKSLRKEVIAKAHDLEANLDQSSTEEVASLKLLARQLDEAFDGMFVWMRQFNQKEDEMTDEELESYLLEQREMVQKVNEDIKKAMSDAKIALKN